MDELLRKIKKHQILIVMGDLNVQIGKGKCEDLIGKHGLGERNERGERLVEIR